MANPPIKLKRSAVPGKIPLAVDLAFGELAVNYNDGEIYYKNSGNAVKSFFADSASSVLFGTVEVTGAIKANGSVGANGTVLTSNGTLSYWNPPYAGATGGSTDKVFWENDQTLTSTYTVTSSKNAMTAGPVTINAGVVITIPTGSVWTIV